MSIAIDGVTKYYGAQLILKDVKANIAPGDRIGLVGPNGSGKTTLLKIIAGIELPDDGAVLLPRQTTVGYLDQEVSRSFSGTLREFLLPALQDLLALRDRMRDLEKQMASGNQDEKAMQGLLERYARMATEFETRGGYEVEARVKQTVQGLGLDYENLDQPMGALSGGERVRAGLARLLLSRPSLLLLDEPTNHLDLKATEWLESYLADSDCSLVVVSHDRYFLDRVAGRIWEIANTGLHCYRGNYSAYARQRQERIRRQEKLYEEQQEEINKLEAYVRKYMGGNRTTMAKSRQKRLERIERISPPVERDSLQISFSTVKRTGEVVFRADRLAKVYAGEPVFSEVSFRVKRGDRLGIIGPNGAGKTTLLSILAGRLEPSRGEVRVGHQVQTGYYSQTLSGLNEENTVLEEVLSARNLPLDETRSFLARFLFRGDEVHNRVGSLSGGEKARLSLAKLMLSDANVLLLDEPTNHLDIESRKALESALRDFAGTVIMVSHDRYFLDEVATHILLLQEGKAQKFAGNYSAFKQEFERQQAAEQLAEASGQAKRKKAEESRRRRKVRRQQEFDRMQIEEKILALEEELARLETDLSDPDLYSDGDRARELVSRHRRLKGELEKMYGVWEKTVEQDLE